MKAVPSRSIRDHRAVFTISEVVDPGCGSVGSSYDVLPVVFREMSILQINHRKDRLMRQSINSYRIPNEIFSAIMALEIIASY